MKNKTIVIDVDFCKRLEKMPSLHNSKQEILDRQEKIFFALTHYYPKLNFCQIADICDVHEKTIRTYYKKLQKTKGK